MPFNPSWAWVVAAALLLALTVSVADVAVTVAETGPRVVLGTLTVIANARLPPAGRLATVIAMPVVGQTAPPAAVHVIELGVRVGVIVAASARFVDASGPALETTDVNTALLPAAVLAATEWVTETSAEGVGAGGVGAGGVGAGGSV
ncbi:MAG TPA: hypothetical protein PKA20_29930 [Burkholderiaceae bacterium]|nr:hypothetical protein [Burkholderiaceae bacterium]